MFDHTKRAIHDAEQLLEAVAGCYALWGKGKTHFNAFADGTEIRRAIRENDLARLVELLGPNILRHEGRMLLLGLAFDEYMSRPMSSADDKVPREAPNVQPNLPTGPVSRILDHRPKPPNGVDPALWDDTPLRKRLHVGLAAFREYWRSTQ